VQAHPLSLYHTIMYKVVVYAPAERADTLPLFLLYPYMYSVVHSRMAMSFESFYLQKCLISCAKILVFAKVCVCAKLFYICACPKIGMKRNLGMTVSDQLLICQYFILRHHVVEVANELYFSIYVNNPDSDNIA
jgi:hypothetical protein